MDEEIGRVTHYFGKIGVAVIEISAGSLKTGETVRIKGHTTDFTQPVGSLQQEHQPVAELKKGASGGMKVSQLVHEGDKVYKVTEGA
jgi:putative protease